MGGLLQMSESCYTPKYGLEIGGEYYCTVPADCLFKDPFRTVFVEMHEHDSEGTGLVQLNKCRLYEILAEYIARQ